MKKYLGSIIGLSILGVILIFGFISTAKNRDNLRKNGIETKAVITKVKRNTGLDVYITYDYFVNGKKYSSEREITGFFELCDHVSLNCIGDSIDIVYSPKNPKENQVKIILYNKPIGYWYSVYIECK